MPSRPSSHSRRARLRRDMLSRTPRTTHLQSRRAKKSAANRSLPEREARGEDSAPHYNQGYEKTIDRVADHLKLRGRQFSSWFERNVRPGGRPTYGTSGTVRTEREERRQPEPSRDPNATRYYRPEPGERLRD